MKSNENQAYALGAIVGLILVYFWWQYIVAMLTCFGALYLLGEYTKNNNGPGNRHR